MKVHVTRADGGVESIDCENGVVLMRVLAERDLVQAICGGECSCATCQVYVDEHAFDKLPAQGDVERELLAGLVNARPSSRLSCQITLFDALDGLRVEIAKPG